MKWLKILVGKDCSKRYLFFGPCADVPTNVKQSLADTGPSVSDGDGHYDIDGMSYNSEEGVIVSGEPRPLVLTVKTP